MVRRWRGHDRGRGLAAAGGPWAAAILAFHLLSPCAAAARVPAQPIELVWNAPEGCVERQIVLGAIERRIAAVKSRARRTVKLAASVQPSAGGYALTLRASAGEAVMVRRIEAATCADLAQATALIAALLVETVGTTEEGESLEAGSRLRGFVQSGVWSDLGSLPEPGFGPVLAVGLMVESFRSELSAGYLAPRSIHVADREAAVGDLRLLAFAARVCYAILKAPDFGPCLSAEYGSMWGRSRNVASPERASNHWLLAATGLHFSIDLTSWLAASAQISAGFPLARPHFDITGLGPVHDVPAVVARAQVGLEWRF